MVCTRAARLEASLHDAEEAASQVTVYQARVRELELEGMASHERYSDLQQQLHDLIAQRAANRYIASEDGSTPGSKSNSPQLLGASPSLVTNPLAGDLSMLEAEEMRQLQTQVEKLSAELGEVKVALAHAQSKCSEQEALVVAAEAR